VLQSVRVLCIDRAGRDCWSSSRAAADQGLGGGPPSTAPAWPRCSAPARLYHRVTWSPLRAAMDGQLDLAMIFFLIAAHTRRLPCSRFAAAVDRRAVVVWGAAAAGIALKAGLDVPAQVGERGSCYVTMGSLGAFFLPEIDRSIGCC